MKVNKFFFIVSVGFLAWMMFLTLLIFIAAPSYSFWNALFYPPATGPVDVSSQYSIVIPVARYFIEPFAAVAFVVQNNYELFIPVLGLMIVVRVVYVILKYQNLGRSKKGELIMYPIRDILRLVSIYMPIAVGSGLLLLLIGYLVVGFIFVNLYFMALVQLLLISTLILVIIKTAIILIKLWHPHLKLAYSNKKRYKNADQLSEKAKIFGIFRRETVYVLGISLLFLESSLLLVSTYFPTYEIQTELEEDELLLDFHVHTTYSDGWVSVSERIQWYVAHGISGAAFSDHDNLRGSRAAKEYVERFDLDFIVIPAIEWTDHENGIHMNYFGIWDWIVPLESETDGGPLALNASDMIKHVKSKGGYVIVNHYNTGTNEQRGGIGRPYTLTELRDWGVDGFEIINGGGLRPDRYETIKQFCLNNSLICISATDEHTNEPMNSFTRLKLLDNSEDTSVDNIFGNLRYNQHQAIAIREDDKLDLPDFLKEWDLDVIEDFGEYFLNCNVFQILSWMAWSALSFTLLTLIYLKIRNTELEKLKKKILNE